MPHDTPRFREWFLTISCQANPDRDVIHAFMEEHCKKHCYQRELSKSGFLHYNGNISTNQRYTLSELWKLMDDNSITMALDGIRIISKNGLRASQAEFYCMKAATRVEGPWTDKDPKPEYIQKRFRNAVQKGWQYRLECKIRANVIKQDDRHIIMVMDQGNEGKSWFLGHAAAHNKTWIDIASTMDSGEKMIQFLCSDPRIETGGEYVIMIDMPRSTSKKHWWTLCQGLESIKQGRLYDTRNCAKRKVIEPPQIVCFMNHEPPEGCMTKDVFQWFNKEEPNMNIAM